MNDDFIKKLSLDFEVFKKHNTPICRKIEFQDNNIYITKQPYERTKTLTLPSGEKKIINDLWTGKNEEGSYRIFAWYDYRAKYFLMYELKDYNEKLGHSNCIGEFEPTNTDLTNIKYLLNDSKHFYYSAEEELSSQKNNKEIINKIKSIKEKIKNENLMKMQEIVPSGKQGKAIYGEGNYILEGAAGTGKTTVLLHKIKLLKVQNNISSDKILVLIKDSDIAFRFYDLLKKIDIPDINIFQSNGYLNKYKNLGNFDLVLEERKAEKILKEIIKIKDNNIPIKNNENSKILNISYKKFDIIKQKKLKLSLLPSYQELKEESKKELKELKEKKEKESNLESLKNKMRNELLRELNIDTLKNTKLILEALEILLFFQNQNVKVKNNQLQEYIKNIQKNNFSKEKIEKLHKILKEYIYVKDIKNIDENLIYSLFLDYKIEKKIEINLTDKEIKEKANEKYKPNLKIINEIKEIKQSLFKEIADNIEKEIDNVYAGYLIEKIKEYNNWNGFNIPINKKFHTTIVDEAQELSKEEIELIRIYSENTILSGDIFQNSTGNIINWEDLLINKNYFIKDNKINKFSLIRNFRQTYELGELCHSYRLLMQNKSLYTIEGEYFENEKGFPKPQLKYINEESFISLIIEKKKYISENFDKKIPIAIFYENENTLLRFKNILKKHNKFKFFQKQNKLTFTDKEEDSLNYDILFVDVNKISGREFPVVIAPLIKNSNDSNIYIMLSRAKYDLTLITKDKNSINDKIERLIHHNIIE